MEDLNARIHPFKKMDRAIFEQIDKFKTTPNYTLVTDFYNNLEEEQQKLVKGGIILVLILLPAMLLSVLWWQNQNIRGDFELRSTIMSKAQQIIAESRGVSAITPEMISMSPIDAEDILMSRISNAVTGGVDTNKLSRGEFIFSDVSEKIKQTEAVINFNNLSNDELVNLFSNLIQREKMRISEVSINRNADTGLLVGNFRVIHLSLAQPTEGE